MSRFRLTDGPIEPFGLDDPGAGAFVSFEGRVRNHNAGQSVDSLEYEAYGPLAAAEGERIIEESILRFQLLAAGCVHRVGHLQIGDTAIRAEAVAGHRQAAFEACQYIVDEVKKRVPIWKKEHYSSGSSDWINCHQESTKSDEDQYYERQIRIPQLGREGQAKLRAARVLVVGAGGLGCAALPYLAAAGVGHIGIVDSDIVEISNLHRQILYTYSDAGKPKAELAANRLRAANPFVEVASYVRRLNRANAPELLEGYELIVDGSDNFETKFLLNDFAVRLGMPLIQASIYQVEGHLHLVVPGGACLRCLWPTVPEDGCVGNCADAGVLGAVPGVFGALQATEAIKLILGMRSPAASQLITLDLLGMQLHRLEWSRNPGCPVCGNGVANEEELDIDPETDLSGYAWIDVREEDEVTARPLREVVCAPTSRFEHVPIPEGPLVLVCASGVRSRTLVRALRAMGRTDAWSLPGGWATAKRLGR